MALALCGPEVGGAIDGKPLGPCPDSKPDDEAYIFGSAGVFYSWEKRVYQHRQPMGGTPVELHLLIVR